MAKRTYSLALRLRRSLQATAWNKAHKELHSERVMASRKKSIDKRKAAE